VKTKADQLKQKQNNIKQSKKERDSEIFGPIIVIVIIIIKKENLI
jgi:hypothetical protein